MSSKLKPLDLTGAVVGTQGTIDFNQFAKFNPRSLQQKAHIWLFNESGCGTDLLFNQSNNSHYLPAGAWGTFDLEPNDSTITVTVTYLLPNPPVSTLNAIYYAPGEPVPQAFTLGNSPIGIGGSVQTSSVQTLSNENSVLGTKIIDIGTLTINDLLDIFNDHFLWKVQQSGVAHQVLAGNNAGNPLQLGQAGDTSEVLGSLLIDQSFSITTAAIVTNGTVSGNTNTYMWTRGTVKCVLIQFNAMKTNPVNIVLPVAFTAGAHVIMGDGIILQFKLGAGALVTCNNATGFGAFGTSTAGISAFGFGDVLATFDTIVLNGSGASTHSGWARIEGV